MSWSSSGEGLTSYTCVSLLYHVLVANWLWSKEHHTHIDYLECIKIILDQVSLGLRLTHNEIIILWRVNQALKLSSSSKGFAGFL
ncbi:unnamed protein product [Spirodela intermedia]|uniref:Uncharacterized protein n=1 Tax=Spirodela intermedia TaxID=51605 RepID=A0A7I8L5N4_SPIIN|nr:unnamed protein product [Spirodela intermedia]